MEQNITNEDKFFMRREQAEDARAFSTAQLAYIARREKECAEHGCDDNGHKHD